MNAMKLNQLYRIGWTGPQGEGMDTNLYNNLVSAVQVAELLQTQADDRPLRMKFHVVRQTGQRKERVYECR